MKILMAVTYYRPHWTGLTQYAARLAENLSNRGHEVSVVTYQHQRHLNHIEILNKVKVKRVQYWIKLSRSILSPFYVPTCIKQMLSSCSDVLVIYLPLQEVLPLTLLAKILKKKVYLVHNGDLILPKGKLINKIFELLFYWTTNFSIKLSDGIIIQTEDYAKESKLLSQNKTKWITILPLYDNFELNRKGIAKFKKRHRITNKVVIGFTGRFVEEKGIDILLQAIPLVKKKIKNVVFVFAGGVKMGYENFWEKIEPYIKDNEKDIRLLGLITDKKELANFYYSLDLYVQPSRTDCFPSSLAEALQCGVPAVCTNTPGARWMIKKTGAGILVEKEDANSMAKGIIETVGKDYKKEIYFAKELFNNEKVLRTYENIFRRQ